MNIYDIAEIPDNVPVSFLEPLLSSNDEMLFLVSVPNADTATGFMSKYMTYDLLTSDINNNLSIEWLFSKINELSDITGVIDEFSSNVIRCNTVPSPYIISAIYLHAGNITRLAGYRLKTGMETVFKNELINATISATGLSTSNLTSTSLFTKRLEILAPTSGTKMPYIDFHFDNSTEDYTSRIIEVKAGTLSIITNLGIKGNLSVGNTLFVKNVSGLTALPFDVTTTGSGNIVTSVAKGTGNDANKLIVTKTSVALDEKKINAHSPKTTVFKPNDMILVQDLPGTGNNLCATYSLLSSQIKNDIDETGNAGEVIYLSPDGEIKLTILNSDIYVCENDEDIKKSKEHKLTFNEVYTSWVKDGVLPISLTGANTDLKLFSKKEYTKRQVDSVLSPAHYINDKTKPTWKLLIGIDNWDFSITLPDITNLRENGYHYWVYNKTLNAMLNISNTPDCTFFRSALDYGYYDITIRLHSLNLNDDYIGFIAAYNEDNNDRPHMLEFIRTPNTAQTYIVLTDEDNNKVNNTQWGKNNRSRAHKESKAISHGDITDAIRAYYDKAFALAHNYEGNGIYESYKKEDWEDVFLKIKDEIENGKYTDSVINSLQRWQCMYNSGCRATPSIPLLSYPHHTVECKTVSNDSIQFGKSWPYYGAGVTIRILRNLNQIKAWTTAFKKDAKTTDASPSKLLNDSNSTFTINLTSTNPKLSAFIDKSKIGFSCYSLAYAMWEILDFLVPKTIIDTRTNEISVYTMTSPANSSTCTSTWQYKLYTELTPLDIVGTGRFTYNYATGKTFYAGNGNFIKISEVTV